MSIMRLKDKTPYVSKILILIFKIKIWFKLFFLNVLYMCTNFCEILITINLCIFIYYKIVAYAFAELIDNALSATSENTGLRNIDVLLVSLV